MLLTRAIKDFLELAPADGYCDFTLRVYESALFVLAKHIGDLDLTEITPDMLREFSVWLQKDYQPVRRNHKPGPLSTASLHRYWKSMRAFFRWCDREYGTGRPDEVLTMPRATHAAIIPYTEQEIQALLAACDEVEVVRKNGKLYRRKHTHSLRDRAIILVLLDTGIRIGELSRLLVADFNQKTQKIEIKPHHVGKTTPRFVKLDPKTVKAVWRWLQKREDVKPEDHLFTDGDGRLPMSRHSVRMVLWRLAKRAGVQGVHPHRFRHTFSIQYIRNGGDIFSLREILGQLLKFCPPCG